MSYYPSEPPTTLPDTPKPIKQLQEIYQRFIDTVTPYPIPRWTFTGCMFFLYCTRVFVIQGYHVISYILGIYLLNRLLGFISPKIDPETDPNGDILPTKSSEEFRPFMRRLPELKFWSSCTAAIVASVLCTGFPFLDIPVFWPILVMYFVALFYLTMKRQILHMIKYRYVPFTYGKPRHRSSASGANRKL